MKHFERGNVWLNLIFYGILSLYIVFVQGTHSDAISLDRQVFRHERLLEGNSEFFNPWQYRVLSIYLAEGFHRVLHVIVPFVTMVHSLLALRVLQSILIFLISDLYCRLLGIHNPWLRLAGQLVLGCSMANSVYHSDLSLNTYFDVLFYLLAAVFFIQQKFAWFIPLTIVAALNRETSALIPAMLAVPHIEWPRFRIRRNILIISILSVFSFVLVFLFIRLYYGFRPPEPIVGVIRPLHSPVDYLLNNLLFLRTYPLLAGTLSFLPLVSLLFLRRLPLVLRQWFWTIVPVWFLVHFFFGMAAESRLFLVPQALIFIPSLLVLIDGWYKSEGDAIRSGG